MKSPEWISVTEVAGLAGVSRQAVLFAIRAGLLGAKAVRSPNRWRRAYQIRRDEAERYANLKHHRRKRQQNELH